MRIFLHNLKLDCKGYKMLLSNIYKLAKILILQKSCCYKLLSIDMTEKNVENFLINFIDIHSKEIFTLPLVELICEENILAKFDSYSASRIGLVYGEHINADNFQIG